MVIGFGNDSLIEGLFGSLLIFYDGNGDYCLGEGTGFLGTGTCTIFLDGIGTFENSLSVYISD